eukprot:1755043-Rhodomonas_salina.3
MHPEARLAGGGARATPGYPGYPGRDECHRASGTVAGPGMRTRMMAGHSGSRIRRRNLKLKPAVPARNSWRKFCQI